MGPGKKVGPWRLDTMHSEDHLPGRTDTWWSDHCHLEAMNSWPCKEGVSNPTRSSGDLQSPWLWNHHVSKSVLGWSSYGGLVPHLGGQLFWIMITVENLPPNTNPPFPDAPCMDYLPTLGEHLLHSRGNVGKYYLHGASGIFSTSIRQISRVGNTNISVCRRFFQPSKRIYLLVFLANCWLENGRCLFFLLEKKVFFPPLPPISKNKPKGFYGKKLRNFIS